MKNLLCGCFVLFLFVQEGNAMSSKTKGKVPQSDDKEEKKFQKKGTPPVKPIVGPRYKVADFGPFQIDEIGRPFSIIVRK